MIAAQRHRRIVEYVAARGAGKVTDLAREFGVTEETIRRDLRELSKQGALARTHGGALPAGDDGGGADAPFAHRDAANTAAKTAIARAALARVEPGVTLAFDASSTAHQLARLLPDEPRTVVTNSLAICSLLARRRHVQVVCTGGVLDPEAMAFTGLHARRTLQALNIHTLFFSCHGVDLQRGISEVDDRQASIKQQMLASSRHRVLLVDTSKLGHAGDVFVGGLELADCVIVERTADPAARAAVARLQAAYAHVVEAEPL